MHVNGVRSLYSDSSFINLILHYQINNNSHQPDSGENCLRKCLMWELYCCKMHDDACTLVLVCVSVKHLTCETSFLIKKGSCNFKLDNVFSLEFQKYEQQRM